MKFEYISFLISIFKSNDTWFPNLLVRKDPLQTKDSWLNPHAVHEILVPLEHFFPHLHLVWAKKISIWIFLKHRHSIPSILQRTRVFIVKYIRCRHDIYINQIKVFCIKLSIKPFFLNINKITQVVVERRFNFFFVQMMEKKEAKKTV